MMTVRMFCSSVEEDGARLEMDVIVPSPRECRLCARAFVLPEYFLEVGVEQQKWHGQGHENLQNTKQGEGRGGGVGSTNISVKEM